MILKSVDLPQPEGPITPTNSPGATDSETPSTAMMAPSGLSNRLVMLSTARMASGAAAGLDAADNTVAAAMALSVLRVPSQRGSRGHIPHRGFLGAPRTADETPLPSPLRSSQLRLIGS